jgi:hypothetical protein
VKGSVIGPYTIVKQKRILFDLSENNSFFAVDVGVTTCHYDQDFCHFWLANFGMREQET